MEYFMPTSSKMEFYSTGALGLTVFVLTWIFLKTTTKLKPFGKKVDKIPGPVSVPIVGTLALMFIPKTEILEAVVHWANKFKGCFKVWVLNEPLIWVSSPEYVQKILGSKDHVEKSSLYKVTYHLVGSGLVTADPAPWKAHRKLLLPSINGNKMIDIFMEVCNEYLTVFQHVLAKQVDSTKTSGEPISLHPTVNRLAFDMICEVIYGKSENTLKNSITTILDASHKNKVVCSERSFSPWLRWEWLWKRHPLQQYERDVAQVKDNWCSSAIAERRQVRKEQKNLDVNQNQMELESGIGKLNKRAPARGAMIDMMLDAAEDPANEMTEEYLKYELMTFLVAGHDTSAEAMLWVLFIMGNHNDIQEKVYEELQNIFGDNQQPNITLDDISRMTYLDKCIKETLRMYPAVPLLLRKVHMDVELEPGLVIPAGSEVGICVPAVHQNPEIYPNPNKFDPERFSKENSEGRHPYAYCPFSAGPRNCLGKRMGEIMTRMVMASFFLNYSVVSVQKPEDVKLIAEITLGPDKPIYFHVKRRC